MVEVMECGLTWDGGCSDATKHSASGNGVVSVMMPILWVASEPASTSAVQ